MSGTCTVEVVIEGWVQGVGYRYWTQRKARALGLSGTVRNRTDGAVEATFSGAADAVAEMIAACEAGPGGARVDRVTVSERGPTPVAAGFEILDG